MLLSLASVSMRILAHRYRFFIGDRASFCVTLYEFYGDGCPHCEKMAPKVESLEQSQNVEVKQLEVWNNEENAEKLQEYDKDLCGGVPFFYNTETQEYICGEADMETLKNWAGIDQGGEDSE